MPGRNPATAYIVTAIEGTLVALSLIFVTTQDIAILVTWEAIAVVYLIVGFVVLRRQAVSGTARGTSRRGVLDTLSWSLPVAASFAGITAAVLLLVSQGDAHTYWAGAIPIAGSIGVIISWLLLHTGFAHVYEATTRTSGTSGIEFPRDIEPDFGDYLYFSFTIGTSFAVSDVTIVGKRQRWTALVHSVVSFFYNALVIAVAIQVIQQQVGHT